MYNSNSNLNSLCSSHILKGLRANRLHRQGLVSDMSSLYFNNGGQWGGGCVSASHVLIPHVEVAVRGEGFS